MGEHKRNKKSTWYKARHKEIEQQNTMTDIATMETVKAPSKSTLQKVKDHIKCLFSKQK